MSNMNFNCDVCGREVRGCTFVNGMKFCAKCYQETFGNKNMTENLNNMYEAYLKILNEKDKQIADLEAKLAESKEKNKQLVKALNGEVFINYKLPMENAQLKQQLEDAEEHIDNLELQLREQYQIVDEKDEQLAEKEKLLKRIMSGEYIPANIAEKSLELSSQDKISFCIEQLEKVKEFFLKEHKDEELDTDYIITKDAGEIADFLLNQIRQLKDQQINELKGETK